MNKEEIIKTNLKNCLVETDLEWIGTKKQGKVRDTYDAGDKLVLVTTDRQSAFDRIVASVPFKGAVLNLSSAWWFTQTNDIVPNHVLAVPDPNVTVGKKCSVFPVEFVIRGFLTGVTSTAVWTAYEKGERVFCGNILPEGMKKNQRFAQPIITPTTKSDEHDRKVSAEEIVSEGLMSQEDWDKTSELTQKLFVRGQQLAAKAGLILVDTKYEFGKDDSGNIILIDEIHTPDSSRWWFLSSYEERFARNEEPEYFDKELLRLWYREHSDPYKDKELPLAPDELVIELASRYIDIYEKITARVFEFTEGNINERIENNLKEYFKK
ncbi:MAG: phosphoribosylaminoimidazolesuccinocarboxamide synthase [Dehalococcoidales bacterium]|nr:phosphoribosylaminoimidazolesuccinocarboxamide synthase [Dehalococcoidales bacterium]